MQFCGKSISYRYGNNNIRVQSLQGTGQQDYRHCRLHLQPHGNGKAKRGRHVGGQLRGLHVPENKRKDPATPAGVGDYRLFQHQGTLLLQGQRDTPDAGRTPDKEQQGEHRQPDNQPPVVC